MLIDTQNYKKLFCLHSIAKEGTMQLPLSGGLVMPKQMTTEQFIEKARAVRGNRFDYSLVDYRNSKEKVTIICPDHGPFEQTPNNHLVGKNGGCNICAIEVRRQSRLLDTKTFIEKARAVHGDRYDYSQVEYVLAEHAVTIICHEHGAFKQGAHSHLQNHGCPTCANEAKSRAAAGRSMGIASKTLTTEEFIEKARKVHGDRYDYSQTDYQSSTKKVIIVCREHGPFEQQASNHVNNGHGCAKCAREIWAAERRTSTEEFIKRAREVHGDRYDYSQVDYKLSQKNVTIICREHGPFEQWPASHTNGGQGCPSCALSGFDSKKPGHVYYLKVTGNNGETLYKIGITNKDVNSRFPVKDLARIEVLQTVEFENGQDARDLEQLYLKSFKAYRYQGEPVLSSGNTELFTRDIMNIE